MNPTQTQTIEAVRRAFSAEWNPMAAIRPDGAQNYVRLFTARYPEVAQVCGNRLASAVKIMTTPGARQRGELPGIFLVQSSANPSGWYQVDVTNHTCTCPDHPGISARGGVCKHRLAVGLQLLGPDWVTEENKKIASKTAAKSIAMQNAENAWKKQLELVDRWEWHCEQHGYYSPEAQALQEAVIAATRQCEQLQDQANSI